MAKTEPILAWHWLCNSHKLSHRHAGVEGAVVTAGQVLEVDQTRIKLCKYGLHASISPLDALIYAPGATICRVEVGGKILHGDDKLVCSQRRCLWIADATELLHIFACDVAEYALHTYGRPVDPRSQAAIDIKRLWLNGELSDSDLDAARSAAEAAARSAAEAAAWSAARSAARSAAWSAARSAAEAAAEAAWSAAWSAWSAARSAARFDQARVLHNRLVQLEPGGE